jgi:DNA-binding NarL/FixJ family response regulator
MIRVIVKMPKFVKKILKKGVYIAPILFLLEMVSPVESLGQRPRILRCRSSSLSTLKPYCMSLENDSVQDFGAHRRNPLWQERSKRWIVIVDDEEAIRKAMGQHLFEKGYQVTACSDGQSALKVVRSRQLETSTENSVPDAIVSDIRMPGMSGLQLLREIREDVHIMGVPVILLTAKGLTQDRIVGYDAGADAYIPKPFDPEELVTILDNVIDRHRTLSEDKVNINDLKRDLSEIKYMLLEKGGGGVGNGFVEATDVFLTPDEREILELLCQGLINKEIGERTFLSTRRVEQLLSGMFRKANVKNRTELVRWAISTGNVQL